MPKNDCPCTSFVPYAQCCRPYHRGEREAKEAVALMRSRFSAFALGDVDYLWTTLHPQHEDRARPEEAVKAELRRNARALKYRSLRILDSGPADERGVSRVLFRAGVFESGKDLSFVERSEFAHDGTRLRYLGGVLLPVSAVKGNVDSLRLDSPQLDERPASRPSQQP